MSYPPVAGVETVAVVGAGVIGASWCALFLARGLTVRVYDPDAGALEAVAGVVERAWGPLAALGEVASGASPVRLHTCGVLDDALRGANFVQECGPDREPAKQALFDAIDGTLPADVVVASSTSSLLISRLQAGRRQPQRYLVGHPFNPPHLVPLVEVVAGEATDPAALEWAMDFYRHLGRRPVRVRKEVVGHIANRLTAALYQEAVHLVMEGVASVEDVDDAVRFGPGMRYAVMGPHLTYHLAGGAGGIEHFLEHLAPGHERRFADLGRVRFTDEVKRALREGVREETGDLDIATLERQRDEALVALLRALTPPTPP